ncbi:MAG: chemotaxis protein CheD [Phycisphaerae bacterium]|nr:chemotaxis protein CheD [Phycisphaerae bacterium]
MSTTHFIGIAEVKIVRSPDKILTLVGSCVGVVLHDPRAKVGGMAHVMLPNSRLLKGHRGKFADTAVDWLIEEVLRAGGRRAGLTAKIAGGAALFGPDVDSGIGQKNIHAVKARLAHHKIQVAAADLGGTKGRKMLFDPTTGSVQIETLGKAAKVI